VKVSILNITNSKETVRIVIFVEMNLNEDKKTRKDYLIRENIDRENEMPRRLTYLQLFIFLTST
jgi:hypothetical protein